MSVQTFPITSLARWGSWTTDRAAPLNTNSAMNSDECEIALNFTGTQVEIYWGADTSADGYDNPAYSVSVDGAAPYTFAIAGVGGSYPSQWLPLIQGGVTLTDGPHTAIAKIIFPYYGSPSQWNLSTATAIRVTGANPAASPLAYRATNAGKMVVFDGDSRTQGTGSTDGPAAGEAYQYNNLGAANKGNSYPADFHRTFLDSTWTAVNQGSYGDFTSHMLARQPTDLLTQFNPANSRNVLIFWGGINDFGRGDSAAMVQQTVTTYIANARAAGVKELIVGSLPYSTQEYSNAATQIDAYNAWLKNNWKSIGATGFYDAAFDPAFVGHVVTPDWNVDAIHFSDSGYTKIAAGFAAAFNAQVSVTGVAVTPPTATFAATLTGGQTQQFSAIVSGNNGPLQTVTWAASAGTISSAGLFTAPAATTTAKTITVTATSTFDNTKSGTATVSIPAIVITVTSVVVSPSAPTISGGATQQFSATVSGTNNPPQSVTWAASAGTISGAGLLTAPASASTTQMLTITATSVQDPTKSATASVTVPGVNPAVADMEFEIGAPVASLTDPSGTLVSGSDGYIHIPISAKTAAGIPVDLTQQVGGASVYPVMVCPTPTPAPQAASYQAGDWLYSDGVSYARLQVGPANPLLPGNYRVYAKIAGEYTLFAPALLPVAA